MEFINPAVITLHLVTSGGSRAPLVKNNGLELARPTVVFLLLTDDCFVTSGYLGWKKALRRVLGQLHLRYYNPGNDKSKCNLSCCSVAHQGSECFHRNHQTRSKCVKVFVINQSGADAIEVIVALHMILDSVADLANVPGYGSIFQGL